jgi:hypothetical protein
LVRAREAAEYHFTSALPVTVLKLLAPVINARFREEISTDNSGPPVNLSLDRFSSDITDIQRVKRSLKIKNCLACYSPAIFFWSWKLLRAAGLQKLHA